MDSLASHLRQWRNGGPCRLEAVMLFGSLGHSLKQIEKCTIFELVHFGDVRVIFRHE